MKEGKLGRKEGTERKKNERRKSRKNLWKGK